MRITVYDVLEHLTGGMTRQLNLRRCTYSPRSARRQSSLVAHGDLRRIKESPLETLLGAIYFGCGFAALGRPNPPCSRQAVSDDFPELTPDDIHACPRFAVDRKRWLVGIPA